MINKSIAFRFAHQFAREISEGDGLRAKLRHAADMQSHTVQAAVDRFVDENLEAFIGEHLAWLETERNQPRATAEHGASLLARNSHSPTTLNSRVVEL